MKSSRYGSASVSCEEPAPRGSSGCGCCPLRFSTRETPAYLLLALHFTVCLYSVGLLEGLLLPSLAALWCLCACSGIVITSSGRGWPWRLFAAAAAAAALVGLALGWLCREIYPRVARSQHLGTGPSPAAFLFTGIAVLVFLIAVLLLSHAFPRLGFRTVGSSADFADRVGWGWHPEMVAHMQFGCQQQSVGLLAGSEVPEQTVLRNLLDHRCYWSGEPAYDYAFHLANENSFIGCLLCHPRSPFERIERLAVLAIILPLIVFPVAAFSVLIEHGPLRMTLQLLLITLPRNLLKAYLQRLVIADDKIIVGKDRGAAKWRRVSREKVMGGADEAIARAAHDSLQISRCRGQQAAFLGCCAVFAAAACAASGACVRFRGRPLAAALADSSDGLAFANVVELLLDLLMPHRCEDGSWALGFFGRWWSERPQAAAAGAAAPVAGRRGST